MSSVTEGSFVHKWFASERTKQVGKAALYLVLISLTWVLYALLIYTALTAYTVIETIWVGFNTNLLRSFDGADSAYINASINFQTVATTFIVLYFLIAVGLHRIVRGFRTHIAWYLQPVVPFFRHSFTSLGRWVAGDKNPDVVYLGPSDFPRPDPESKN